MLKDIFWVVALAEDPKSVPLVICHLFVVEIRGLLGPSAYKVPYFWYDAHMISLLIMLVESQSHIVVDYI